MENLTLGTNATATLGSPLNITSWSSIPGTVNIGSSAILNTGNGLTLKSNDSSTAVVTAIPEDATTDTALGKINGTVTIERLVHSNVNTPDGSQNGVGNIITDNSLRAWRIMTAPIASAGSPTIHASWQDSAVIYNAGDPSTHGVGTLVTGASATNGIDAVSGTSMSGWDISTHAFVPVTNTEVPISNGNYGGANAGNTGYVIFIRGDKNPATVSNPNNGGVPVDSTTLSVQGNLITGRQTYTVPASPGSPNTYTFTLIGNPYASPVDLGALSLTNVKPTFYVWNPNLNSVGTYVTIDFTVPGAPVFSPQTGLNDNTTQYLQSSQAFLVAGSSTTAQGSVVFDESDKTNLNNNYVFRPASGTLPAFRSNLFLLNADSTVVLADGNLAQYDNSFSTTLNSLDAVKLDNTNETFALVLDGTHLSIERRPVIVNNDTLFFNLTNTTQRSYQFQFAATALNQPGLQGFLKDSYTGDSTALNLNSSTSINFAIDANAASQNANRFMVVFETPLNVVPVTFTSIKASQQTGHNILVTWNVLNEQNIKSYTVERSTDGKTFTGAVTIAASGAGQYNWTDVNAATGDNYYRIQSIGNDGSVQYSTVAKVNIGAVNPAFAVYPNPVSNGVIGLQFTNQPQGTYIVKLLTTLGQVLVTKVINHAGGSASETIPFSRTMAKGVYQLEINSPDNTKTSINLAY